MKTVRRNGVLAALTLMLISGAGAAAAGRLPTAPGTCVLTRIAAIGERLIDAKTGRPIPGSGSAVAFANKGYQVSYDEVSAILHSRAGDSVFLCLIEIPRGCPPGDNRGRVYTTTNLRTLESWTLPDAEHSCGGA